MHRNSTGSLFKSTTVEGVCECESIILVLKFAMAEHETRSDPWCPFGRKNSGNETTSGDMLAI
jgi:hypothetical protein